MASKPSQSRFQVMTMLLSLCLLLGISLYLVLYYGTGLLDFKPSLHVITSVFVAPPPPKPITVKSVTYYNKPPWISQHIFDTCEDRCELISSTHYTYSDVVIFHGPDLYLSAPLRKYKGQTWVFHDLEPPTVIPNFSKWKRLFNWTLSNRRDADIFRPYGNFTPRTHAGDNEIPNIVWKNKTRNIGWIVSHCGIPSQRLKYGKELQKYIDIDIYGGCGKLFCPRGQWKECIEQYKYYASFENSLCIDYVTEKCFRVFSDNVTSIPITRGAADYVIYLPPGSYLSTSNFSSISKLANFLKKLSDDKTTFMTYFNWRRYYKAEHLENDKSFCELCRRLHHPSQKYEHLYEDIHEWLQQKALPRRACQPVADLT